jgi:hypothetical protein
MATTLPDNPAPGTRLALDVVWAVVVGAAVAWVTRSGVVDSVAFVALVTLVADDGVVPSDVLVCVAAVVGVDDTAAWVRADALVLGWVTGCSGMSVREKLEDGCSSPGTVTWSWSGASPGAVVRVVGADVDVADGADWPTALPQAASNRRVMP